MRRLKREPAADLVISELRRAILTGILAPGDRIKSEELAETLGVSRMPVRQALTLLEREGLVKADRWRGTMVTQLDAVLLKNIYDLREIIESAVAAALAKKPFDSKPVRELIVSGREVAAGADIMQMIDLDLRFHTMMYDAFGNRVLSDVMVGLWDHVRRVIHAAVVIAGYRNEIWDEHEAIIDAIDARDPERAADLSRAHIASSSRIAMRNLDALNKTGGPPLGSAVTERDSLRPTSRRQRSSSTSSGQRRRPQSDVL